MNAKHSKCFLWLRKLYVKAIDARTVKFAHLRNPKSSNSSFIAISLLELSLAFPMSEVARTDAKVSHSYSDE